jgi:SAM-dependent methyltransferase
MDEIASRPLVSVVIPCHNQARFLSDAIASVRAQSHTPVEVVVIDDGSSDHTAEVAASCPDVVYVRQRNQGLGVARNTGMSESRGEYLVFLDADDRLLPDALRTGLECLQAHPRAAFASGHYRFIREDGEPLREYPPMHPQGDAFQAFLRGNHIGMHATVMYRRAALHAVGGFDADLPACEDYDVYLRISRRFPVCRHSNTIAEYRQHGSNMSRNTQMMLESALSVLERQAEFVRGDLRMEDALRAGGRSWRRHFARQRVRQLFVGGRLPAERREILRGIMAMMRYGPGWAADRLAGKAAAARNGMAGLLPTSPIQRGLRAVLARIRRSPRVGHVDFGDLRRVTPISRVFGYDRGLPIDRYYIESFLARNAEAVRGRVLEVGDDEYTRRFGGGRVTTSDVLHVAEGNPRATFVGDLTKADHIPGDAFDCVILTQTLHLIYSPGAALRTLHRILRPGGVLLLTVPGISQIDRGEWGDTWYWSFTLRSARRMFDEVFPPSATSLESHGNVLAAVGFLHGLTVNELRPEELDHNDPQYQLIIAARAVKPRPAT